MFLSHRLSSGECGNSYDSGYSGRDSSASNMTCNPDMQSCIPQIMQLLDQVHSGQQQILQLWQIKKAKLDQCLQLRLFEQECEKVIRLISRKAGSHYFNKLGPYHIWDVIFLYDIISYFRCLTGSTTTGMYFYPTTWILGIHFLWQRNFKKTIIILR